MDRDENVTIIWRHRTEAADRYLPGKGIRSRIAWWLRRVADKIDEGRSVRIHIQTEPGLSEADTAACITRGFEHANRLAGDLASQAACEQALKKANAEPFDR